MVKKEKGHFLNKNGEITNTQVRRLLIMHPKSFISILK